MAWLRLLAGVRRDVHRQGTPLDETLSASWRGARVRPLVGVYPVVPLQVRLAVEALQTRISNSGSAKCLFGDRLASTARRGTS